MSVSSNRPRRRFLHLWLPWLPAERARRSDTALSPTPGHLTSGPLALVARRGSALRLLAIDAAAAAAGLSPGLTLADARSQLPELKTLEADPAADLKALERLTDRARRFSPAVAAAPPDGLYLETSGLGRLFGGEAALLKATQAWLAREGFSVRAGLADTPALAFALARFGGGGIVKAGGGPEALGSLPVSALQLDAETAEVLSDLGLKRVAQLMAAPRAALARRLSPGLLDRLDQALGVRGAALAYRLEIPPYRVELRLAEPISQEDQVLGLTRRAARRLSTRLEAEALGGRLFLLELHRLDGAVKRLEVASSRPSRDPGRIAALFAERVAALNDGLEADFGFDQLRLTALRVEPWAAEATSLLDEDAGAGDFAALADRLDARLGAGSVVRFMPAPETRLPEAAARAVPFGEAKAGAWKDQPVEAYQGVALRPLRLFSPPQPIEVMAEIPESPPASITWRRVQRKITAAEGPERLEPEWGRKGRTPRVRDYYRLEDEEGRRYWVFRSGRYGGEVPARWFLHGLFA